MSLRSYGNKAPEFLILAPSEQNLPTNETDTHSQRSTLDHSNSAEISHSWHTQDSLLPGQGFGLGLGLGIKSGSGSGSGSKSRSRNPFRVEEEEDGAQASSNRFQYASSIKSEQRSILSESSNIRLNVTASQGSSSSPTSLQRDRLGGNASPLIDEFIADDDLNDLKEGLKYALGTTEKDANWFPMSTPTISNSHNPSKDHLVGDEENQVFTNYTTDIPLQELSVSRPPNSRTISKKSVVPTPSPLKDVHSSYSNEEYPEITHTTQEGGFLRPNIPQDPIPSPTATKFTDALTRISNRIAGAGDRSRTEPDPDASTANSIYSANLSRKSPMLKTPIKEQFSAFDDIEFSPYKDGIENGIEDDDKYNANHNKGGNKGKGKGNGKGNGKRSGKDKFQLPNRYSNSNIIKDEPDEYIYNETTRSYGLGLRQSSSNDTITQVPADEIYQSQSAVSEAKNENNKSYIPPLQLGRKKKIRLLYGNSLRLFSPQSRIRRLCHTTLQTRFTSIFLLVVLILQVILLSYRQWDPYHLSGYYYEGYDWADILLIVINVIYTVEVFAQIIAYGFIDDRVVYREVGLPYPKSKVGSLNSVILFVKLWFARIHRGSIGNNARDRLKKTRSSTSKRDLNSPGTLTGSSDDDDDDDGNDHNDNIGLVRDNKGELNRNNGKKNIDPSSERLLDSDTTDLKRKYNFDSFHDTKDESFFNKEELSENDPKRDFRLLSTNTFYKPDAEHIDASQLKRAYLRSSWHRIDFLSMVFFWISLLLSINRYDAKHHITLFRSLSCLRILRLCNLTAGTTTILAACKSAIPQLIDVAIFIACFWLFFGIIGVQSFKSSLTRHCVWTNPDDPSDIFTNSDLYCGSFIGLDGEKKSYITREGTSSGVVKGFRCPKYSKCISGDNPYGGTVSFDNILQSLEMVFVVMSANTFTDIMYYTMDTDNMAACLFFIGCIFVMTVWLLNIFTAVIVASFNVTRLEEAEERNRKANERWIYKYLGLSGKDVASVRLQLNQLKHEKQWLRFYYKFEFLFIACIAVNMFVQCFRSYDMSEDTRFILSRFEVAFTIVFMAEIIVRFLVHLPHWKLFFAFKRNWVDLILALGSVIIAIGPVKRKLGHAYFWLTVFQILRFYRVVLATPFTRTLWLKMAKNIRAIFDLALFYFILLFLVSIILARYFEGTIPPDEFDNVDFPMNTLPAVFIALYVITSTENWTDVMYSLQEYATTTSSRSFGSIFLIAWFMLSNMIILNIFIAVIANTLEVSEEIKRKHQLIQFIEVMTSKLQNIEQDSGLLKKIKAKIFKRREQKDEMEKAVVNMLLSGTAVLEFLNKEQDLNVGVGEADEESILEILPSKRWQRWVKVHFSRFAKLLSNPFHTEVSNNRKNFSVENFEPADFARNIMKERNNLINKRNEFLQANPRYNYVFYVMGPRHKFRRLCQRMVKPSYGERIGGVPPYRPLSESLIVVMFLATIGLVILACYMTPIFRMNNANAKWMFWSEFAFALVFTLEFIIKIVADGILFTPNAYFRSSWNHIDFVVLVSLWIEAIAYLKNDGDLSRIVRGLKALRALRLLTISETAKSNFHNTMIAGFGKILSAAIMSLSLLFPFSIWGLNIFNGRLGYCLDGESDLLSCFNEFSNEVFNWEIVSPNVYTNPQLEFNKFSSAFATLFEIVSLEGWTDLLQNLMNSTGIGTVPETNANPINGVFIVFFNFISTVFILTLFVSVIISNYSRTTGRAYMTKDQISWYQVKNILVQVRPSKRKDYESLSVVRKFCYRMTIERHKGWYITLNCTLFAHTLALLLECFPSGDGLNVLRIIIYTVASALFLINAVMLAIAQGPKTFCHYRWNIFNLFVSFGAFITTLVAFSIEQESPFQNVNKLFLVGILLFVIPRNNRLSQLLRFASASLPSILSLSFTWIIVFLVFAIAMNQIFGLTRIGPNGTGNLNLRSVPKTLIVLFRCSFGEGWNYIMEDYTLSPPFCTNEKNLDHSDCGSKQYAYILFIAWNIISMYIFLNMFISLILDGFDYVNQKTRYGDLIKREEIRKFKRTWQKFDPQGTGYIKPIELPQLLHALHGALSFHFYTGQLEIKELCQMWIHRNDPKNPYDVTVDFDAIEQTVNQMDIPKIRARRKAYEMFMEEAFLTMELNDDPGISFTRILLQLPLYTTFDTGKCFNLIDYLERRLLVSKVQKKLHTKRVYETIAAYACRWKYQKDKRLGIKDDNLAFDKRLKRSSYLMNKDLWLNTDHPPTIFVSDEHEHENGYENKYEQGPEHDRFKNMTEGYARDNVDNDIDSINYDIDNPSHAPVNRSSLIYGDQSFSSGIYYPSSPVAKSSKSPQVPQNSSSSSTRKDLFITIPNSSKNLAAVLNTESEANKDVYEYRGESEKKQKQKQKQNKKNKKNKKRFVNNATGEDVEEEEDNFAEFGINRRQPQLVNPFESQEEEEVVTDTFGGEINTVDDILETSSWTDLRNISKTSER